MLRFLTLLTAFLLLCSTSMASNIDQDLRDAIDNEQLNNVRELLDKGANINSVDVYGFTPLIWATTCNNLEIFNLILAKGADVNFVNKDGGSALFYAVTNQKTKQLEILLKKGANPNVTFEDGDTPLSHAKSRKWGEFPIVFKILEKAGAK